MNKKVLLGVLCVLLAGTGYRLSRETQVFKSETSGETVLVLSETEESGGPEASEVPKPEESGLQEREKEGSGGSSEQESRSLCYIHVCGAVSRPGVYGLEAGSRIFQAVEAAGGFTEEAAEGYLNMAEPVTDGMKIVVPKKEELSGLELYGMEGDHPAGFVQELEESRKAGEAGKVNLNTASKEELMTLTGIGASRAEDIIRYREAYGFFENIEDVMQVNGIKDAAFEKIREKITV